MHDFMQSLHILCPVAAIIGLSIIAVANAPMINPSFFSKFISEIFSFSGHPFNSTPREFTVIPLVILSDNPFEQESLFCLWQYKQ